jgi:hypothetical protein
MHGTPRDSHHRAQRHDRNYIADLTGDDSGGQARCAGICELSATSIDAYNQFLGRLPAFYKAYRWLNLFSIRAH